MPIAKMASRRLWAGIPICAWASPGFPRSGVSARSGAGPDLVRNRGRNRALCDKHCDRAPAASERARLPQRRWRGALVVSRPVHARNPAVSLPGQTRLRPRGLPQGVQPVSNRVLPKASARCLGSRGFTLIASRCRTHVSRSLRDPPLTAGASTRRAADGYSRLPSPAGRVASALTLSRLASFSGST